MSCGRVGSGFATRCYRCKGAMIEVIGEQRHTIRQLADALGRQPTIAEFLQARLEARWV